MGALGRFLDAARDGLGAAAVVTDPDVTAGQVVDWTGRFRGAAAAVVRPSSADDVAAVVRLARSHGVALVPPGGHPGLVGGSVPLPGEVVVDLPRLDRAEEGSVGKECVDLGRSRWST